jgi:proline racemase
VWTWNHRVDAEVNVPGLGAVQYDLGIGGAYYAYVDATRLGLSLDKTSARELIDTGMAIKHAVADAHSISHPFEADLGFLYGTIFVGPAHELGNLKDGFIIH